MSLVLFRSTSLKKNKKPAPLGIHSSSNHIFSQHISTANVKTNFEQTCYG